MAKASGEVRDRILGLINVKAGELLPNPRNWRDHPPAQRDLMEGLLNAIGFVGAALTITVKAGATVELEDGSTLVLDRDRPMLVDGHMRQEIAESHHPDQEVPILLTDIESIEEADELLTVYDPISAMAKTNHAKMAGLAGSIATGVDAVDKALADMRLEAVAEVVDRAKIPAKGGGREACLTCPQCSAKFPRQ